MLVLSRRENESVVLHTSHGPIKVMVVRVGSCKQVRLGVEAPKSVRIVREEVDSERNADQ